jgi:hypothetical protein
MQVKTRRARWRRWRGVLNDSERPVEGVQSGASPLLDEAIGRFAARGVVSPSEVVDLLLDVRSAIAFDAAFTALRVEMDDR